MPRRDWIELRLLNWARWRVARGGGDQGYAAPRWEGDPQAGRNGYREAVIPISDVEASDTDDAINRLHPPGLRLAVVAWYCGTGVEAEKALALGVAVSTMHKRIVQAHDQLADHFLAQQERAKVERARVEGLLQQARPRGSFTP